MIRFFGRRFFRQCILITSCLVAFSSAAQLDELPFSLAASQYKRIAVPNLIRYVNPLIGTAKMGHTYPGATVPFGMVQLSPDTDTLAYEQDGKYNGDVYKYCAGYQYSDRTIVGFSHTHFSGTGHSDLGDILIMPTTGALQLNPGTASNPANGFRSAFSHDTETASPDYYSVKLEDHQIVAELTTSSRVGMHRYTFQKGSTDSHIILDLVAGIYNYDNKNVWTFVRVENDSTVTGYRQTNGWGRTRTVYFAITFSKKFKSYGYKNFAKKEVYRGFWGKFDQNHNFPEMAGTQIRAYFDFDTKDNEQLLMKVALSSVSTEGALLNLTTEIPHWDFDRVKRDGQLQWNAELGRITIDATEEEKTNFYTAMYHTFLSPTIYMDVDGKYKGLDQNIHQAEGFTNYTTFSLWDTYRALHPFLNLIQPQRNSDMVSSMLAHYDQSAHHLLPVWSHYANDNWCMIGYHSVSVIADAVVKGTNDFDAERALEACVTTARNRNYDGLGMYIDKGYIPEDKSGSSVSKTLEYAYDDWCIAQMAKKLNKPDIYAEFTKRSQNYKNVYDKTIGYMRPKLSDGTFKKEFDVLNTHGEGFIEGNSWNYSLYVPHNPDSLIRMMGGKKRFSAHLDSLFTMNLPDKYFENTEDISRDGIIGNYVHGNEPSHHVAYLFNDAGMPSKTQATVRMILKKMYRPTVDGLGGNDDCGQMSAWYIFSSLGFYPVAPGSDHYALGSPSVKNATLRLDNGKTFTVEAVNQSDKNVYVQKVELNGKPLDRLYLTHEEITAGGRIVFLHEQQAEEMMSSKLFFLLLTIAAVTSCQSEEPVVSKAVPRIAKVSDSTDLLDFSTKVLTALKDADFPKLAEFVHPEEGVRFSPYAYIDKAHGVVFDKKELYLLEIQKTKIWGEHDGSGDPIVLTPGEYLRAFVYTDDFLNAEAVHTNKSLAKGNMISNIDEVFGECTWIEYFFPGHEPQYEGMDWSALRLVFKKRDGKFYLVGVIHDQWTI